MDGRCTGALAYRHTLFCLGRSRLYRAFGCCGLERFGKSKLSQSTAGPGQICERGGSYRFFREAAARAHDRIGRESRLFTDGLKYRHWR